MGCTESTPWLSDGILDPEGLQMNPQCSSRCTESSTPNPLVKMTRGKSGTHGVVCSASTFLFYLACTMDMRYLGIEDELVMLFLQ